MTASTFQESEVLQFLKLNLVDGTKLMIPTHQLTEALNIEGTQVVSIPDVHPALLGVYNWRGEVLWLLDVGLYLGYDALYAKNSGLAHINVAIAHHQNQLIGLCVKDLDDIIRLNITQLQTQLPPDISPHLQSCYQGYWLDSDQHLNWVLDIQAVLESLTPTSA